MAAGGGATRARAGGTAVVLTFDPHPSRVLGPERAPAALMTLDQKAEILARPGRATALAVLPFTPELAAPAAGGVRARASCATRSARDDGRGGRRLPLRPRARGRRRRCCAGSGGTLGFRVDGRAARRPRGRAGQQQPRSARRWRAATSRRRREMLGRPLLRRRPRWCAAKGAGAPSASRPPTSTPVNETLPGTGRLCLLVPVRRPRPRTPLAAVVNVGRRPTFGGGGDHGGGPHPRLRRGPLRPARCASRSQARLRDGADRSRARRPWWRRSGSDIVAAARRSWTAGSVRLRVIVALRPSRP